MAASVFTLRRSVFGLIMFACLAGVSCSDRESPTAPGATSMAGKATISGTLLAEGGAAGAPQPLAGVTARVASSGQTTLTDGAGNFTLAGVSPGAVGLDFRGAGIQASTTVNTSPGTVTRVTVTVDRGRGTVRLSPRSDDDDRTKTPTVTGTPPTATATRTPRPDDDNDRTKTPTVTGTPPTATATRTPRPDDDDDRTKTPTVTGTPPTATPTRTPGPDDDDNRTRTPTATATATTTATTPQATRTPTPTRTPEVEDNELEGIVGTISGSSFMLLTRSGPVTIQTNAGTQFRHDGDSASLADIKTGVEVEVQGARQADGSVLASRVSIQGD